METMSTLPHEVIVEILLQLPVKSLLRFRCVSKAFRTILSNSHFIHLHVNRSVPNEKFCLFLKSGSDLYNVHSPIDFQSPWALVQFENPLCNSSMPTRIFGACNGVILCLSTCTNTIFLLNPSTRSYKKLPNPSHRFPITGIPVLGLGCTSLTYEYKVLQIDSIDPPGSEVNVYRLGTNTWRRVAGFSAKIQDRTSGVLVNGSLHWVATPNGNPSTVIVSFDVEKEEFGEVSLPVFPDGNSNWTFLGVIRGCLCIFCNFIYNGYIKIWVMKEYGVVESWTQEFIIRQPTVVWIDKYMSPLRFLQNGEILLRKINGRLIMYDPRSQNGMDLPIRLMEDRFGVIDYAESLVSIRGREIRIFDK